MCWWVNKWICFRPGSVRKPGRPKSAWNNHKLLNYLFICIFMTETRNWNMHWLFIGLVWIQQHNPEHNQKFTHRHNKAPVLRPMSQWGADMFEADQDAYLTEFISTKMTYGIHFCLCCQSCSRMGQTMCRYWFETNFFGVYMRFCPRSFIKSLLALSITETGIFLYLKFAAWPYLQPENEQPEMLIELGFETRQLHCTKINYLEMQGQIKGSIQ